MAAATGTVVAASLLAAATYKASSEQTQAMKDSNRKNQQNADALAQQNADQQKQEQYVAQGIQRRQAQFDGAAAQDPNSNGRAGTILTSPLGVVGTQPTSSKTLLGM